MKYDISVGGRKFSVDILDVAGGTARVTVDGAPYDVVIDNCEEVGGVASRPERPAPGHSAAEVPAPPLPEAPRAAVCGEGTPVRAPMPGVIVSVRVQPGDHVAVDQTVVTLEAMKMENDIAAPSAGTVTRLCVSPGSQVRTGDVLLFLG